MCNSRNFSIHFWKMKILKLVCCLWRPVLVTIMTIKLHRESILIQLQQILWTCCVFLSSLNNTFFIVLVIIFSNKSFFCFNYTNYTLFIHYMNYFLVVPRIIFLICIKDYFLIGPRIIFCSIANLFFGPQCIAGLAFEVDWFWVFDLLWPFWKLCKWRSTFIQRECQGEPLSKKETHEQIKADMKWHTQTLLREKKKQSKEEDYLIKCSTTHCTSYINFSGWPWCDAMRKLMFSNSMFCLFLWQLVQVI